MHRGVNMFEDSIAGRILHRTRHFGTFSIGLNNNRLSHRNNNRLTHLDRSNYSNVENITPIIEPIALRPPF